MSKAKTQWERIAQIETSVEFILKWMDEFKELLVNHDKRDEARKSETVGELKSYIDLKDVPIKSDVAYLKKSITGKISKAEVRIVYVTIATLWAIFEFFKGKVI